MRGIGRLLALVILAAAGVSPAWSATVDYTGSSFRDPFKNTLPEEKKVDEGQSEKPQAPITVDFLRLSGVVWNSNKPQAIINGKVVGVGSTIEGAEITAIDEARVSVRFRGKDFVLSTASNKGGQP